MNTRLNSGDVLNSRYQILHQIGHGGFGRTYLAKDINRFDELCVVKEFAPQLQGSFALNKAQELFEREAGILYRLEHPQIPRFRELFRYKYQDKGRLFLVQDYIKGQTYHTLINNRSGQGIKFSETEITHLLCQILPVLEYIHSIGVIHRDIAPDNLIWRSSDGMPVLIDFGSIKEVATKVKSQLIKDVSDTKAISLIGTALGKDGYAPPEQIGRGIVYPHSDLYALAATAVVLLTGKEPQELILLDNYEWHWQEEITLSPKLTRILTKMLASDPSDRFSSATEVLQAIKNTSVFTPNQFANQNLATNKIQVLPSLTLKNSFVAALTALLLTGSFWCLQKKETASILPITSNSRNSAKIEPRLRKNSHNKEQVLSFQDTTPKSKIATAVFPEGNFIANSSWFSKSPEICAKDSEALIYFYNPQIEQKKAMLPAFSVSFDTNIKASKKILQSMAQTQTLIARQGEISGIPLQVPMNNNDDCLTTAQPLAIFLLVWQKEK